MPFDRLIQTLDQWAEANPGIEVLAQVGQDSSYRPSHVEWVPTMTPQEFRSAVQRASLIVGHAGMGTILTALEFGKPLVVLPRQGALRETRNDHQIATARRFQDRPGVHAAMKENELPLLLDRHTELAPPEKIASVASNSLLDTIRNFIHN